MLFRPKKLRSGEDVRKRAGPSLRYSFRPRAIYVDREEWYGGGTHHAGD
jgi:hypothetical protein